MHYLLDTHTFIWMLTEPDKLGKYSREIIEEGKSLLHLSSASIWEMSIKESIGKLVVKDMDIVQVLKNLNINELPIRIIHARLVKDLKLLHKDPFDRILVAQAMQENFCLISKDKIFDKYKIERIW